MTNPLTQSDVVDNLSSTSTTAPLSAKQGKQLNDSISNKQDKLTNPLTQSDVKNSLTSTSTTTPLSAYQGYIMSRDIPWYGTSSTAASTIAKVATTSDTKFALTTGAKVSIKFTYNNTASAPTLNVDSTGAKSIKAYGTTAPTSWWQAGDVVTFTYDGTNWIMGATEGQISQISSDLVGKPNINDTTTSSSTDTWSVNQIVNSCPLYESHVQNFSVDIASRRHAIIFCCDSNGQLDVIFAACYYGVRMGYSRLLNTSSFTVSVSGTTLNISCSNNAYYTIMS